MKNVTDAISKTIEERMTNPLVGTFAISWLIFNWRPILFLIFSKRDIEHKIFYIKYQFSNPCNILVWPLIIALFYVLALPYITAYIESLIKKALDKKAKNQLERDIQTIKDENELALENIRLEKNKTDLLEANNHNKTIETLNETVKKLQNELTESHKQLEQERVNNIERVAKINAEHDKRYNAVQEELDELIKIYNEANDERNTLERELAGKGIDLINAQKEITRLKNNTTRISEVLIIFIDEIQKYVQVTIDDGDAIFYDLISQSLIPNYMFSNIVNKTKNLRSVRLI